LVSIPVPFSANLKILEIQRVPVYANWSLVLFSVVILLGALERPAEALAAWCSFFGVLLLHECGHMYVAQKLGYPVDSIRLYPFFGLAIFAQPYSRYDYSRIAWGGVAAQAVISLPVLLYLAIFGFTRWDPVNIVLGIFGYYSAFVAACNLLPIPPLDGVVAWGLIPELIRRAQQRRRMQKFRSGERDQ
jgi:Zn-dependent protease